jgi:hypothetical protein
VNESVPSWRVSLDTMTTMVYEIITDTGQILLERSRPEIGYQEAYSVITEKTRSQTAYVTEQAGQNRRFLQIRENGSIAVIDALPELPSDFISPPPELPPLAVPERTKKSLPALSFGSKPKKPALSDTPQNVRVKVKVPQAVLYGASGGSLLIGLAAGLAAGLWLR